MNEKGIDEMTDAELRQWAVVDICKLIGAEMIESENGNVIEFRRDGESVKYFGFQDKRELYTTAGYNLSQCREQGLKEIHDGDTVWPNGWRHNIDYLDQAEYKNKEIQF